MSMRCGNCGKELDIADPGQSPCALCGKSLCWNCVSNHVVNGKTYCCSDHAQKGASVDSLQIVESLKVKMRDAIAKAEVYREICGDPIENLKNTLEEIAVDIDVWQQILDEPYR